MPKTRFYAVSTRPQMFIILCKLGRSGYSTVTFFYRHVLHLSTCFLCQTEKRKNRPRHLDAERYIKTFSNPPKLKHKGYLTYSSGLRVGEVVRELRSCHRLGLPEGFRGSRSRQTHRFPKIRAIKMRTDVQEHKNVMMKIQRIERTTTDEREKETKTSLQLFLFSSLMMTFIASIQIFINILQERPYWLIILLFSPVPILIFTAIMISLDLAKRDYLTLRGHVKTKSGNKIIVNLQTGKDKKFRINNDQMTQMTSISEDEEIEVEYYRRTKAVIKIKNLNVKKESVEG